MSQTFNVVKCRECLIYQVDINKKSTNKWSCKMCGLKQSLKQVFFNGSSVDCRERVKKLNELRGDQEDKLNELALNRQAEMERLQQENERNNYNSYEKEEEEELPKSSGSKWNKYLSKKDKEEMNYRYGDQEEN